MPPSKAELQFDRDAYYQHLEWATSECTIQRYDEAISRAVESLKFVDGMMQFERRFERRDEINKDHGSIEAIDIVLQFAPFLFRYDALSAVAHLLNQQRRIDRNSTDDLSAKLGHATSLMWRLRALWDEIETAGSVDLDVVQRQVSEESINRWESLRIIRCGGTPVKVALVTQMQASSFGKCPRCGVMAKGAKSKILETVRCPKCNNEVLFAIVTPPIPAKE